MNKDGSIPATISIQPGSIVYFQDREFLVTHILDLSSLLAKNMQSGHVERIDIRDVSSVPSNVEKKPIPDLMHINDKDWSLAQKRFEIIRPLVNDPERTRTKVEERAKQFGNHVNTLYGWIKLYEECGTLTVLMPQARRDKGSKKIDEGVEVILQKVIDEEYLTRQQKSPVKVHEYVVKLCRNAGLKPPHLNTIRNRIKALPDSLKVKRRRGSQEARDKFEPSLGAFPGADYPYAVVQIDHTPLDIITVDDIHRLPLDRPYLTLAIDVFSRMILGFYISYDPPGAISTGLCLSQAILPKELFLASIDISTPWPCWGMPVTVHVDNAKEFRGKMLEKACEQYGINIEWRPVARPNFGGHVERLLGTLAKEIHTLPGTTFSNIQQRGTYDSTKKAVMTLSELEKWLSTYITEVYHQRLHSSIKCSPIKKYEEGVFGTKYKPGSGLPSKVVDEERLKLDFLPYVERTVQDYGLMVDDVYYYHDVLRPWINATVPGKSKLKRKFIIRRDPRDISAVWFFDPELDLYFEIPYRDLSHPSISIWELRAAKKQLLDDGRKEINEMLIFDAYDKMNYIRDESQRLTKTHRKQAQRKKQHGAMKKSVKQTKVVEKNGLVDSKEDCDLMKPVVPFVEPFDEMEEL